jgi:hypothetical protein
MRVRLVLLAALSALALAGGASGSKPSTLFDTVDNGLCSFPLRVTGTGSMTGHFGRHAFILTGEITETLRNLNTGAEASVSTTNLAQFDNKRNTLTLTGKNPLISSNNVLVGFLNGKTVISLNDFTVQSAAGPNVAQSPCELVGGPPAQRRSTAAPWDAPVDAVAGMELAGLTPLFANLVKHVHSHVTLLVDGTSIPVPAGIGIGEPVDVGGGVIESAVGVLSPLHTHTSDGILHVEADIPPLDLTLGQFFDEWQVQLTSSCLGSYCNGRGKTLRAYVNGAQVSDPRTIALTDHADIVLVYGLPGVPSTLPVYTGPWPDAEE